MLAIAPFAPLAPVGPVGPWGPVAPVAPAGPGEPDSKVHEFSAVQAYKFDPASASVLKNVSPTEHVEGTTVPDLKGFVVFAAVKSTLLVCVRKSTSVCV